MIHIDVTVYCEHTGCERSTKATAQRSHFPFRLVFEWFDVRFPAGPTGEPSKWFHGPHPKNWWDSDADFCPEHATSLARGKAG